MTTTTPSCMIKLFHRTNDNILNQCILISLNSIHSICVAQKSNFVWTCPKN